MIPWRPMPRHTRRSLTSPTHLRDHAVTPRLLRRATCIERSRSMRSNRVRLQPGVLPQSLMCARVSPMCARALLPHLPNLTRRHRHNHLRHETSRLPVAWPTMSFTPNRLRHPNGPRRLPSTRAPPARPQPAPSLRIATTTSSMSSIPGWPTLTIRSPVPGRTESQILQLGGSKRDRRSPRLRIASARYAGAATTR